MSRNLLLVVFLSVLAAVAVLASDSSWDHSFHSAPGKKLDIDLRTGGDITVYGISGDEVNVRFHLKGSDRDDLDVKAEETPSGVEVRSEYVGGRRHYNASADVEVQVPSKYDVSLETMGGAVSIKEVEGEFSGKTMGGRIRLQSLKGKAELTTMGGEIDISDSDLDGNVKTMGGNITLQNVSGNVHGSTMGGSVRQEGTRTNAKGSSSASAGTGEKRIHSMGGSLELDSAPDGASLETMGGEIHVGSAADHVKATTMGGNIMVDSVDGWAKLTTMGGDVTMKMVGDPSKGKRDVDISSMGGDVQVTLPEGISATFDLETEYMTDRSRRPKIVSDFPVNVTESSDCQHDHGEPCKALVGTGKIGSGANRIKIRTIQGDIIIKKG